MAVRRLVRRDVPPVLRPRAIRTAPRAPARAKFGAPTAPANARKSKGPRGPLRPFMCKGTLDDEPSPPNGPLDTGLSFDVAWWTFAPSPSFDGAGKRPRWTVRRGRSFTLNRQRPLGPRPSRAGPAVPHATRPSQALPCPGPSGHGLGTIKRPCGLHLARSVARPPHLTRLGPFPGSSPGPTPCPRGCPRHRPFRTRPWNGTSRRRCRPKERSGRRSFDMVLRQSSTATFAKQAHLR